MSDTDEDAGTSSEDESAEHEPPPRKVQKISDGKLYRPPTSEELHQLKETEDLFHSSLFRLQISELLSEVKLKQKRRTLVERSVEQLTQFLLCLPAGTEHPLNDTSWLTEEGVRVPLSGTPAVKGVFGFHPPVSARVIGSFLHDTCIRPNVQVDVVVEIPKECFQEKDHLNQRYVRKRAQYLAHIAAQLQHSEYADNVEFTLHHGNQYKPIIAFTWKGVLTKGVLIRLHATPETGVFKLNRFHVTKNNVRHAWFTGNPQSDTPEPATPHYNTSILSDLTLNRHTDTICEAQTQCDGLTDGIILLKVWLNQRQLSHGYGGCSGFIMSMYVCYLLSKRKITRMMSSYQVMRTTLCQLATSDWLSDPITMATTAHQNDHQPSLADFRRLFHVVFVDATGFVNFCHAMNKHTYYRVRHEAQLAVEMLGNTQIDSFNMLFMTRVPFLHTFDHLFHVSHLECFTSVVERLGLQESVLDAGGHLVYVVMTAILDLLHKALGSHIQLIQCELLPQCKWPISQSPPQYNGATMLTFGLLLDKEKYTSLVDKGPTADSVEAKEFSCFWGKKCELRRFQDGGICEAVVWSGETISAKRLVCKQVVRYVLNMHAHVPAAHITYIAGQLDSLLKLPWYTKDGHRTGTGEEHNMAVLHCYDALCKTLRQLVDLPLNIHAIQGTDAVFSFAEVFPAVPMKYTSQGEKVGNAYVPLPDKHVPCYTPAMKVVCLLEGSGKWPDNKEAIRRLKAAFYIELSRQLDKQGLITHVFPTHLLVYKDGYVFRLLVSYLHELTVERTVISPDGLVTYKDNEASLSLHKEIVAKPKLVSMLHGVQQQHNTYTCTTRLVKRWVSSHLLAHYIPEEAIDLVTASLYIHPEPLNTPTSPLVGFLRFLNLLTTFDWKTTPLIINFNTEFTSVDISDISTKFSKERTTLPLVYIATPQDKLTSHWTKHSPTVQSLQRLVVLANQSLQMLQTQLMSDDLNTDFKLIFRTPLDHYDVLIYLHQKHISRQHEAIDVVQNMTKPQYGVVDKTVIPVVDFDPVDLYLQELKCVYGSLALFFCDKYGGALIGVVWKHTTCKSHEFKVSHINAMMLDSDATRGKHVYMTPNIPAILEDFKTCGNGLVKSVQVPQ